MCGIVGYIGPQNPKEVIIAGLKKMEYRGYDSAGVAILDHGHFKLVRAEGKLKNLEEKLRHDHFDGQIGIGHTRWATHGVPSERNAHPHSVDGVSLVHNGIIENDFEIKTELLAKGAKILSDTDSELVAHLIAIEVRHTRDLFLAVKNVLVKLRGAFSIVVVWDQQPDTLVAFKDGPPLVVGLGEKESFIVSDAQAALAYTNEFVHLEDREIVKVKNNQVQYFSAEGKEIKKQTTILNWSPEQASRRGYSHYMLKEIFDQPEAVASVLEAHIDLAKMQVNFWHPKGGEAKEGYPLLSPQFSADFNFATLKSTKRLVIIACGSSYYTGLYGEYVLEAKARIPVEVEIASEFRYRQPVLDENTLVLLISQSGETADTLAALRLAKSQGAKILSICNSKNSSIDREAHGHLYMNCGAEVSVASTKALLSTMVLLNLLALELGKAKDLVELEKEQKAIKELLALPAQLETVLAHNKYFEEAASELQKFRGFLYMGRGPNYPAALEGALKLKELAYLHAEGYAAGEMKHGPLALIDSQMAIVMIAPSDEFFDKTLSNLQEAKARGGQIISIGTGKNEKLQTLSKRYLGIPAVSSFLSPILAIVPLQLMSFHMAVSLGHDVDQPRNLAKSVTVE